MANNDALIAKTVDDAKNAKSNDASASQHILDDIRGDADEMISRALRDRRNIDHWHRALGSMIQEIQGRLAILKDKTDAESVEQRDKTKYFLLQIERTRDEAKTIKNRRHRGLLTSEERAQLHQRSIEGKRQRGEAGEVAARRLIELHRADYNKLLAEEYDNSGIPWPDWLIRALGVPKNP